LWIAGRCSCHRGWRRWDWRNRLRRRRRYRRSGHRRGQRLLARRWPRTRHRFWNCNRRSQAKGVRPDRCNTIRNRDRSERIFRRGTERVGDRRGRRLKRVLRPGDRRPGKRQAQSKRQPTHRLGAEPLQRGLSPLIVFRRGALVPRLRPAKIGCDSDAMLPQGTEIEHRGRLTACSGRPPQ
jgi:hypothetical protein